MSVSGHWFILDCPLARHIYCSRANVKSSLRQEKEPFSPRRTDELSVAHRRRQKKRALMQQTVILVVNIMVVGNTIIM